MALDPSRSACRSASLRSRAVGRPPSLRPREQPGDEPLKPGLDRSSFAERTTISSSTAAAGGAGFAREDPAPTGDSGLARHVPVRGQFARQRATARPERDTIAPSQPGSTHPG